MFILDNITVDETLEAIEELEDINLLSFEILREIKNRIPVENVEFFSARIFGILENYADEELSDETVDSLDRQLELQQNRVIDILDEYSSAEIHPRVQDINDKIIDIFYGYHAGLQLLRDYILSDQEIDMGLEEIFNILFQSDVQMFEVERELNSFQEETYINMLG